jgi:hypothetical protein
MRLGFHEMSAMSAMKEFIITAGGEEEWMKHL